MQVEVGGHTNWTLWFIGILVAGCLVLTAYANHERQALKITQLETQVQKAEDAKKKAENDLTIAKSVNEGLQAEIKTLKTLKEAQEATVAEHVTKVKTLTVSSTKIIKKLPKVIAKAKELPKDPEYEQRSMARLDAIWAQYCLQPTDSSLCPKEGGAS